MRSKLYITFAFWIIMLGLCHLYIAIKNNDYKDAITKYQSYYKATETLLDSLSVDVDSPILETDEGAEYLNAKFEVDRLE